MERGQRGLPPLVGRSRLRSGKCLVDRVGREHAEYHRESGVELYPLESCRALAGHEVVMAGLPRITAPRQITASTAPERASSRATIGSSNAPGTQATMVSVRAQPASSSASRAPVRRRSVIPPLNSAQARPTRSGRAWSASVPSSAVPIRAATRAFASAGSPTRSEDVIEALEEVTHPLPLGPQILDVLRRGGRLQVHPLDNIEPEPSSPPYLVGLLVMRRMVVTPRSTRICAPIPYSRESAGSPSSRLASTVSYPSSWRL